mmetsp:Transcript_6957/g.16428  ORF Transcript_6957/g.16428 Transcript_6957/m.16428 type:complete len:467 (+) Transcript_6957:362-1762(+)
MKGESESRGRWRGDARYVHVQQALVAQRGQVNHRRVGRGQVPVDVCLQAIERLPLAHHLIRRDVDPKVMRSLHPVVGDNLVVKVLGLHSLAADQLGAFVEIVAERSRDRIVDDRVLGAEADAERAVAKEVDGVVEVAVGERPRLAGERRRARRARVADRVVGGPIGVRLEVERVRRVLEVDGARVAPRKGERGVLVDREALRPKRTGEVCGGDVLGLEKRSARHRVPVLLVRPPDHAADALARRAEGRVVPVAALCAVVPHLGLPRARVVRARRGILWRAGVLQRDRRDRRGARDVHGNVARGAADLLVVLRRAHLFGRHVVRHQRQRERFELRQNGALRLGEVVDPQHHRLGALALARRVVDRPARSVRGHQRRRGLLRLPQRLLVIEGVKVELPAVALRREKVLQVGRAERMQNPRDIVERGVLEALARRRANRLLLQHAVHLGVRRRRSLAVNVRRHGRARHP